MHTTLKGLVLRTVKYGETSLIVTCFTDNFGLQTFMVKGARKGKLNKSNLLCPLQLLELEVYQNPQKNLNQVKEFNVLYHYQELYQNVVRNCIATFLIELLLRILTENAPQNELFNCTVMYLKNIDLEPIQNIANYPILFLIETGKQLGYEINLEEHKLNDKSAISFFDEESLAILKTFLTASENQTILVNSQLRQNIIKGLIQYLQYHTGYMGNIRSLDILHTILH